MKTLQLIIAAALFPVLSYCQFSRQGIISYERKTNIKQMVQLEPRYEWIKSRIDNILPSKSATFKLYFDGNLTHYVFESEEDQKSSFTFLAGNVAGQNDVWTRLDSGISIASKQVFDDTYLISDSVPEFKWKIEDEIRTIAGFPCRKALTKICDSVVVVAFYTEQIITRGGPESFHGLPGMILGIAIPRLYTTWFATTVTADPPKKQKLHPPTKGKPITRDELHRYLEKAMKTWRDGGATTMWRITL